ncbi:hypothetical protein FRC09_012816 [Ceratobasidium sp. 395]|nr:hypothetical protein FRC09_012816 [Ceratobasidium sp. 395]
MAAVLAPSPGPLSRRAFRDGALLLANRAANLINIPAARNVARELRTLAKAMKAPAVNDESAREQTSDLEQYAEFIEDIAERISKLELLNLRGTSAELWALLQEFDGYLSNTVKELQTLQAELITVKFACQNEVARRLDSKKEEMMRHVAIFSLTMLSYKLKNDLVTVAFND